MKPPPALSDAWATLSNIAIKVVTDFDLDDVRIEVLGDYWQEHAQDPLDEDELVYLSDGMHVAKDGGLIEQ